MDEQQRAQGHRAPRLSAVLTARSEVARLRQSLDRVESALAGLDAAAATSAGRTNRPDRYFRLLIDVYERGRHGVEPTTFSDLGRARGYDARGLGGFFVGHRAPLRRSSERVTLTPEGLRLLDEYLADAS